MLSETGKEILNKPADEKHFTGKNLGIFYHLTYMLDKAPFTIVKAMFDAMYRTDYDGPKWPPSDDIEIPKPEDMDWWNEDQKERYQQVLDRGNPFKLFFRQKEILDSIANTEFTAENPTWTPREIEAAKKLQQKQLKRALITQEVNLIDHLQAIMERHPSIEQWAEYPAKDDDGDYYHETTGIPAWWAGGTYIADLRFERFIKPYVDSINMINKQVSEEYGWTDVDKQITDFVRKATIGLISNSASFSHYDTAINHQKNCVDGVRSYVMCSRSKGQKHVLCQALRDAYRKFCTPDEVEAFDENIAEGGFATGPGIMWHQPYEFYRPGEEWEPDYE